MSIYELDRRPPHDRATCTRSTCGRCRPQGLSAAPPIPQNPQDAAAPPEPPDAVIQSFGLPRHPDPFAMAEAHEEAAKAIRSRALKAIDLAAVLAARGFSAATLGDGGSRGTDNMSSGERAVIQAESFGPDRWSAADEAYAQSLRTGWLAAKRITALTNGILSHASSDDPTPAGQGECRACARFVRPSKERPSHRLRSGLCPSCSNAWGAYRAKGGLMLWSEWVARRREGFTERNESGQVVKIHTPEPDHEDS